MISTKQLYVVGAITGIGILAYFLYSKKTAAVPKRTTPPKPEPVQENNYTTVQKTLKDQEQKKVQKESSTFPLQSGSASKEVERLQIWLLRNHGWKGAVTGIFDPQTLRLVRKSLKRDTVDQATYTQHQMGIPIHRQIHTSS